MHEQGIAEELVAAVEQTVLSYSGARATRVVVTLSPGALEEESLRAAFDIAKQETAAAAASLVLEPVALEGYCLGCGSVMSVEEPTDFACPSCGSTDWLRSQEPDVTLSSVEIEERETAA